MDQYGVGFDATLVLWGQDGDLKDRKELRSALATGDYVVAAVDVASDGEGTGPFSCALHFGTKEGVQRPSRRILRITTTDRKVISGLRLLCAAINERRFNRVSVEPRRTENEDIFINFLLRFYAAGT